MSWLLTPGSLLFAPGTLLPPAWTMRTSPGPGEWSRVTNTIRPSVLEDQLKGTGWRFFFISTPMNGTAYGFRKSQLFDTALAKLMEQMKRKRYNCLQVDHVEMKSTWGLSCVRIAARPRHVQEGFVLADQ